MNYDGAPSPQVVLGGQLEAAQQRDLGSKAVRSLPGPCGNHRHAHAGGTGRRTSSSCFGLVPEVGISRHGCTQKQILCRVQSCCHALTAHHSRRPAGNPVPHGSNPALRGHTTLSLCSRPSPNSPRARLAPSGPTEKEGALKGLGSSPPKSTLAL